MSKLSEWIHENTTSTFDAYEKSSEGAWILPNSMPGHEDNTVWNNTMLAKRVYKTYSTTAWETDYLKRLLPTLIDQQRLSIDEPIIDVGCGDGRISYVCNHFY